MVLDWIASLPENKLANILKELKIDIPEKLFNNKNFEYIFSNHGFTDQATMRATWKTWLKTKPDFPKAVKDQMELLSGTIDNFVDSYFFICCP